MDLITGATGIVGAHVLLECAGRGPVRAIYRQGSDRSIVERVFSHYGVEARSANIEWISSDLLDMDGLNEAMRGIRHVYHAAAIVSFDPRDADDMHRINIGGTANVVNAALAQGVERLCHVSSTATIGEAPKGILRDETLPWSENSATSAYAISKYGAELEVYRGIAEGLDAVIVNPSIVIGPGIDGRSSMTLVDRLRRGTRFFPPGSNSVVDSRDVAACMLALMERGASGERYLLVGENLSYHQLFRLLSTAFARPEPTTALQPWMLEIGWRIERLRSLLTGSTPFITRPTAHSAITERGYSADKVIEQIGHRFRTAEEAIANVADFLKAGNDQ